METKEYSPHKPRDEPSTIRLSDDDTGNSVDKGTTNGVELVNTSSESESTSSSDPRATRTAGAAVVSAIWPRQDEVKISGLMAWGEHRYWT